MGAITEQLQGLRVKIQRNVKCDENPNGQLTQTEADYMGSLELDETRLENLLGRDLAFW